MEPAGIEAYDEVANRLEGELAFNAVDFGRSRIFKDEKLTLDLSDLEVRIVIIETGNVGAQMTVQQGRLQADLIGVDLLRIERWPSRSKVEGARLEPLRIGGVDHHLVRDVEIDTDLGSEGVEALSRAVNWTAGAVGCIVEIVDENIREICQNRSCAEGAVSVFLRKMCF